MERELSEKFLNSYGEFAKEFDEIAEDLFQGEKLDQMAKDFLAEHADELEDQPFTWTESCFPDCSEKEALHEDMRIADWEDLPSEISESDKILAGVWRRASQGNYLRITLMKSRHDIEEDRMECVNYSRRAIRYDPTDFDSIYMYMITLGWYLNTLTSAKEVSLGAKVWDHAAQRVVDLNPDHPLAHHLLGRFNYNVSNLSWLERTVAKNLLGCDLTGSFEESERLLLLSHELKDDWLPTGLWMAKCLIAQKRPMEEVKEWIDFGLSQECHEPTTEIERKELLELQSKLNLDN